jgi:hypothetical protein
MPQNLLGIVATLSRHPVHKPFSIDGLPDTANGLRTSNHGRSRWCVPNSVCIPGENHV